MAFLPRILAVDDHRLVRLNLRFVLRREGFHVDTAKSGLEALALLHERRYDLLITDIHLPGSSGLELLARARELNPGLAAIILTGSGEAEVLESLDRARSAKVLRKPFKLADLTGAIRGLKTWDRLGPAV